MGINIGNNNKINNSNIVNGTQQSEQNGLLDKFLIPLLVVIIGGTIVGLFLWLLNIA